MAASMLSYPRLSLATLLAVSVMNSALGQTQSAPLPSLPKEPAAIFATAAPLYDFNSPSLKPWHMKVSYQLYDDKGEPSETGIYEYWWASRDMHRESWKRRGVEHTEWIRHGERFVLDKGKPITIEEEKLEAAILHALPELNVIENAQLQHQEKAFGTTQLSCVMVVPKDIVGLTPQTPLGVFPTYCFGPQYPVLHAVTSYAGRQITYNSIAQIQGKFLPRDISFVSGKTKTLAAKVDALDGLSPDMAILNPEEGAQKQPRPEKLKPGPNVIAPKLIKFEEAHVPESLLLTGKSGKVKLTILVGTDGKVHDVSVTSATSPEFVPGAVQAVSQYEYKPPSVNGVPIETELPVEVRYNLSR